jgi:serine/threonine protein kinase
VHRDIKPGNVLLDRDGAKLADFGVALPVDPGATAATRLTETAAIIGTLPYMSPEQRAGRPLDRRSDLFSVGVVLYESATGSLPLGAFPPPSRVNRALPSSFDRVVHRLLQPDPQARFATAAEARRALISGLRDRAPLRRFVLAGTATTLVTALGLSIPAVSRRSGKQEAAQAEAPREEKLPLAGIRVRPDAVPHRAPAPPGPARQAPEPPPGPKTSSQLAPNLDQLLQAAALDGPPRSNGVSTPAAKPVAPRSKSRAFVEAKGGGKKSAAFKSIEFDGEPRRR